MQSITPLQLNELLKEPDKLQLIDVREPDEHEAFNIGGELIPLNEIVKQIDRLSRDKPVVIYCRKGIRSAIAIQRLQERFSFHNLVNLVGGTEAWKKMVES